MVADLPRMGEWSPECERVEWTGGVTDPAVGATLRRPQPRRAGPPHPLVPPRPGPDRRPGREFAFVTEEGGRESTVWRYRFEPVDGGTRVTESYEVRWIPFWARIIDVPPTGAASSGGHGSHPPAAQGRRRSAGPGTDQPGTAQVPGLAAAAAADTGRGDRRPGPPEKESAR